MNHLLDKINTPEWLKRVIIHLVYFVIWSAVVYRLASLLLPEYIAVIFTVWFVYWVIQCTNDKKYIDPPAPIQIFISDKIKSIDSKLPESRE